MHQLSARELSIIHGGIDPTLALVGTAILVITLSNLVEYTPTVSPYTLYAPPYTPQFITPGTFIDVQNSVHDSYGQYQTQTVTVIYI